MTYTITNLGHGYLQIDFDNGRTMMHLGDAESAHQSAMQVTEETIRKGDAVLRHLDQLGTTE